jgi:hypothetical protein
MGQHSAEPADVEPPDVGTPPAARTADVATSIIRTGVPIGVGALLTWAATSADVVVPGNASAAVGAFAATTAAAGYYAIARLLERSTRRPWLRTVGHFMLGGVVPPVYLDAATRARILR